MRRASPFFKVITTHMKTTARTKQFLLGSLLLVILASKSQCALMAQVNVISTTTFEVTLSGQILGPVSTSEDPSLITITFPTTENFTRGGIEADVKTGGFSITGAGTIDLTGVLVSNGVTLGDTFAIARGAPTLDVGETVTGSAVYDFPEGHSIVGGTPFDVRIGISSNSSETSYQSSGVVTGVPEPASAVLTLLGLGFFLGIRRR